MSCEGVFMRSIYIIMFIVATALSISLFGCQGGNIPLGSGNPTGLNSDGIDVPEDEAPPQTVADVKKTMCEEVEPPPPAEYKCPECLTKFPKTADAAGIIIPKRIYESPIIAMAAMGRFSGDSQQMMITDGSGTGDRSNPALAIAGIDGFLSQVLPYADVKEDLYNICYAYAYPKEVEQEQKALIRVEGTPGEVVEENRKTSTSITNMNPATMFQRAENFGIIFDGKLPEGFSFEEYLKSKIPAETEVVDCQAECSGMTALGSCGGQGGCFVIDVGEDGALTTLKAGTPYLGAYFIGTLGSSSKFLYVGQLANGSMFIGTLEYWQYASAHAAEAINECPYKDIFKGLPNDAAIRHVKALKANTMGPITSQIMTKIGPMIAGDPEGAKLAVAVDLYNKVLAMMRIYMGDQKAGDDPAGDFFFKLDLKDLNAMLASQKALMKMQTLSSGYKVQYKEALPVPMERKVESSVEEQPLPEPDPVEEPVPIE
jgi:hypothetical protein